ncbi:MAG: hypothetical protein J7K61_05705 [Thermoplasmata archaeon]|nr:hypothetical protein [Thermoplasmata archaeon]
MWRLWEDKYGTISWLMNQLSIVIVAGVLLSIAVAVPYYGGWQSQIAADSISLKIIGAITSADASFIPTKINISIPIDRDYKINISSSFVNVRVKDNFFGIVSSAKRIPCKVFVRKPDDEWKTSTDLYRVLDKSYPKKNNLYVSGFKDKIKSYLGQEYEASVNSLAVNPLTLKEGDALTVENCIICFDDYSCESIVILYGGK